MKRSNIRPLCKKKALMLWTVYKMILVYFKNRKEQSRASMKNVFRFKIIKINFGELQWYSKNVLWPSKFYQTAIGSVLPKMQGVDEESLDVALSQLN